MADELDILKIIEKNPEISQRKMAEQTGISLGQVNFLIKKFAKKGFVKLEGQSKKSIRYNITSKGIAEKAALSLEYIKISYNAVINLTERIQLTVAALGLPDDDIVVYGLKDEMMDIVKLSLGNEIHYLVAGSKDDILIQNKTYICWEEDIKKKLENKGIKVVNVLA